MNKEAVVEGRGGRRGRRPAAAQRSNRGGCGGRGDPDAPFEIERIFDLVDEDESNTLDREELRELFYLMEISIQEQLETIFAFADADGSGSIDMGEFRSAWRASRRRWSGGDGAGRVVDDADHTFCGVRDDRGLCFVCVHLLAIGAWHDVPGRRPCGVHLHASPTLPPRRPHRAFIVVVQSTFIAGPGFVTQMAAARSSDDDTEKVEMA